MTAKSDSPMETLKNNSVMVLVMGLVLGFVIGHLWTKVNVLENGTAKVAGETTDTAAAPAAPEEPKEMKIKKPDAAADHWKGSKDARFVHVEYSDFECPFCSKYHETFTQLEKEYEGKMAYVYRHFPLSFHPLAQPAAEASECIASLGGNDAFWTFHNDIFVAMPSVTIEQLGDFAVKAGVDKGAFQTCYDSKKFTQKVKDQASEAQTAGVNATPTNVIYDMKTGKNTVIAGAYPFDQAKAIIDAFMKENQ